MSIIVKSLTYAHPDKEMLFDAIYFTIGKGEKACLTGNNGAGKSTLLRLIIGELLPLAGKIILEEKPYYVPQHLGQYDKYTIAGILKVDRKLAALHAILQGNGTEEYFSVLNDDWEIEKRIKAALSHWNLQDIDLSRRMASLSGGEKTKVFLAGIFIQDSRLILLDEPSNHLDTESREMLYDFVKKSDRTLLVVSHDRTLMNLLDTTFELEKNAVKRFGGNYAFYKSCKEQERKALEQDLKNTEKALRKAREGARESLERKQKRDAQGKKNKEQVGGPRILMNSLKSKAEKSTSGMKQVHEEKVNHISQQVAKLRQEVPGRSRMKIDFEESALHKNKILIIAENINVRYEGGFLWKKPLSFTIRSGERISIQGENGAGKTTLIKVLTGAVIPQAGTVKNAAIRTVYVDQQYSLIRNSLSVYEQAEEFNYKTFPEHEVKMRLNRFLFTKEYWDKSCEVLSGGEKMRLMLCCLTMAEEAPDILILDEPTNNLDIENMEILTKAIKEYKGTLIVVSHDSYFLNQIGITEEIKIIK